MKKRKKYCPYIIKSFTSEEIKPEFDENGNLTHNTFVKIEAPSPTECKGKGMCCIRFRKMQIQAIIKFLYVFSRYMYIIRLYECRGKFAFSETVT